MLTAADFGTATLAPPLPPAGLETPIDALARGVAEPLGRPADDGSLVCGAGAADDAAEVLDAAVLEGTELDDVTETGDGDVDDAETETDVSELPPPLPHALRQSATETAPTHFPKVFFMASV